MDKTSSILVVGHNDVVERSLAAHLQAEGYARIYASSNVGLDTAIQASVLAFFQKYRPEYVFLGSVQSGGIAANQKFKADFIYQNLASQNNIVYAAHKFNIKKLLYVASSCVYPKEAAQPMTTEALLTGALEKTSESYAVAKIAGLKLMEAFRKQYQFPAISVIPATIYGPDCDTDLEHAHVMGALVAKISAAAENDDKEITLWGSGQPRREFLFASDFAKACVYLMKHYDGDDIIHIGVQEDITIQDLSALIAEEAGYHGKMTFDTSKPDGAMKKLLDSGMLRDLGWRPEVDLTTGIRNTLDWYKNENKQQTLPDDQTINKSK